jgi:hypothetical protein
MVREKIKMPAIVFALWLSSLGLEAQARMGSQPSSSTTPLNQTPGQNSPTAESDVLKEIRPGIFELGDVKLDKRQRTVSFPARLNLSRGPMEYFLVTTWGKTHESILQTETEPYRIHTAMLLLGAKGAGTNTLSEHSPGSQFIVHPSKTRLPGDKISLEIKWSVNGKEIQRRAEELVFNRASKSAPHRGNWIYNGSRVWEDIFIAEQDGSIVSLITDSTALMNNTAPGHDDDTIWTANTNNLPPMNVPVEVTIKLKN